MATHPDHVRTGTIIANLSTSPNDTAAYGSMTIGVSSLNLSLVEIQQIVDAWSAMGVAGILLDEAGYDFGVSRQRQNDVVDYVHSLGLRVMINAWDPDDAFSPDVESTYNPMGLPTHLQGSGRHGGGDTYLNESFQVVLGEFQDAGFWANKADKALRYKDQFGVEVATTTTVSPADSAFSQDKFDYAWYSTLLYGFDYAGWGELFYSAPTSLLPFRSRPDPGDVGGRFTSTVVHSPPLHSRTTTEGIIRVITDAHTGEFISGEFLHVDDVKIKVNGGKKPKAKAEVKVVGQSNKSTKRATVTGAFFKNGEPLTEPISERVKGGGKAKFKTPKFSAESGDVITFVVLDVSKADSVYEPNHDVETSDSANVR